MLSAVQFTLLQLVLCLFDIPKQACIIILIVYYTIFPRQAPRLDVERKRVLAHLLTMFYVLGVVYTISYTYATLPENHYQFFGASCEHLNVVDLKRQFRIAAKIYHPDKAGQEATDNFVRVKSCIRHSQK
jgi:hypothetical protein